MINWQMQGVKQGVKQGVILEVILEVKQGISVDILPVMSHE